MSNFQIITDSCCDFTDDQYKAMNVACVPLSVMWDEICHDHFSNEIRLKEFYQLMRMNWLPSPTAMALRMPKCWHRS